MLFLLESYSCVCPLFQHSLCVRRTWRLWRPSATWQLLSGSYHQILPMLGSRIREPSLTSRWWSRKSHLSGSAVFLLYIGFKCHLRISDSQIGKTKSNTEGCSGPDADVREGEKSV